MSGSKYKRFILNTVLILAFMTLYAGSWYLLHQEEFEQLLFVQETVDN